MDTPTLRIVSANLCNSLAEEVTTSDICHAQADVFGFAEALPATATKDERDALQMRYAKLGYDTYFVLSDDTDERGDQHYLALLVDQSLTHQVAQIRLGTRNAVALTLGTLLVVMVHLDDRLEATRLEQAHSLMNFIDEHNGNGVKRVLVMGDFNATHPSGFGKLIGVVAYTWAKLGLPCWMPGDSNRTRLGRIGGLLTRLGSMTTSRALAPLDDFHNTRFEDVDRHYRPTMPRRLPIAQLDHMFVYNIVVRGFRRCSFGRSDHLALGVEIQVDE